MSGIGTRKLDILTIRGVVSYNEALDKLRTFDKHKYLTGYFRGNREFANFVENYNKCIEASIVLNNSLEEVRYLPSTALVINEYYIYLPEGSLKLINRHLKERIKYE